MTPARIVRQAAVASLAIGLVSIGYVAYVMAAASAFQAVERQRFEHAEPHATTGRPAPGPLRLLEGDTIGEIRIPRLALAVMVVEGDSAPSLRRAVGHLPETALPGEPGNVVLAGHRDTFFRPLKGVQVGDAVTMTTPRGGFDYVVESTSIVQPTDVGVLRPTGGRTLTLITCFPFSYVGPAPRRFVVRAREVDAMR